MLSRLLSTRLPRSAPPRRLTVLTGARQVGRQSSGPAGQVTETDLVRPRVQRVLSGQLRGLTGEQYESALVGQILTTLQALRVKADSSFLRTAGKLEVDLILEPQGALLAFEIY